MKKQLKWIAPVMIALTCVVGVADDDEGARDQPKDADDEGCASALAECVRAQQCIDELRRRCAVAQVGDEVAR